MKEQYSTQQLNSHLPEVLKQIERGNSIEITQEGVPFAYILSASEYKRLTAAKSTFWTSLQEFYDHNDLEDLETEADVFADVRDRSPGREVSF
ncbi:type II toxin-antitoxin system Phd/YefM family antitoxin [Myxosarcina sp. GI1]|uniref:type II toxin-antitoxin system Phd/YefM family antitoxin n=1 Tax=Myxosarcina sp. GI1 TaxID=1541065 RepID=UPI00068A89B9|nr:type II toxin-antitoxin system prevent-host-death family antitoxin [Myxosarcina sp. GI1]